MRADDARAVAALAADFDCEVAKAAAAIATKLGAATDAALHAAPRARCRSTPCGWRWAMTCGCAW